jgi:hypothetical protein
VLVVWVGARDRMPIQNFVWRWIGWAFALRRALNARLVWQFPRGDLSQTQSQRLREAIAMTAIGRYVSRLSGPGVDGRRTVPGSRNALQSVAEGFRHSCLYRAGGARHMIFLPAQSFPTGASLWIIRVSRHGRR